MNDADVPAAAALLHSLAMEFILHDSPPEAVALFTGQHNEEGLRGFMRAGTCYYAAEVDGALGGFIAMRDNRHVFHMFVDRALHGKGVASRLWRHAREQALARGNPGVFTVNASNFAVPVYEAMGFRRTAPMQTVQGLQFNPMQLGENAHG